MVPSFFVVRISRLWLTIRLKIPSRAKISLPKPCGFVNRRTNHDLPSTTHANDRGRPRRRHLNSRKVNGRGWPKYRSTLLDRIPRSHQTFSGLQQTFDGSAGSKRFEIRFSADPSVVPAYRFARKDHYINGLIVFPEGLPVDCAWTSNPAHLGDRERWVLELSPWDRMSGVVARG